MSVTYTLSSTMEPTMEKQLSCCKDCHNVHDVYAVAVEGDIVTYVATVIP